MARGFNTHQQRNITTTALLPSALVAAVLRSLNLLVGLNINVLQTIIIPTTFHED